MLRIILPPKDKTPLFTHRINGNNLIYNGTIPYGIWMEYWEDPLTNFKFFWYDGIISVQKSEFFEGITKGAILDFLKYTKIDGLLPLFDWINTEIKLEICESLPIDSDLISDIWKYNYVLDSRNRNTVYTTSSLTVRLQDAKIIRSLPYKWETQIRYFSKDIIDINEKIYWFTLCHLKYLTALN